MGEGENTHRTRKAAPSIFELAQRVHRGEITPEEAVQIFAKKQVPVERDGSA